LYQEGPAGKGMLTSNVAMLVMIVLNYGDPGHNVKNLKDDEIFIFLTFS
jgi:hypothetical protein